jgi:hypothetical protein
MEHMAIISSRFDAHAAVTRHLMQRDALRDHPAPIDVDQPFLPPRLPLAPPLLSHGPSRHPTVSAPHVGPTARGGHRPTIDPNVVGRATCEVADLERDSFNMSMNMNVQVMGPNTEFRQ